MVMRMMKRKRIMVMRMMIKKGIMMVIVARMMMKNLE